METYGAVVTTGIYCRPGCPAQPRAENLRAFQLPAAAEAAGYRACLRCRPYRWPHSVSWTAPELVCRGVRLVLDGALDGGTEADLGARLGVSPRHLRRLFAEHLGVTPDGLARSARVHFARQLLDDTDLTITQVAHAAGFGSLRQFNRACRETFREPPRTLRARRRKADRLVADGGLLLRLPFRGPLDWQALLAYFATDAIAGVEHVSPETYRRTILIGGDPGVLEFTRGGTHHLLLRAHLPHWGELLHIVQQARKLANLDFELEQAIHELSENLTVAPLIRARPGLRPPGTWDPFETGVRAIIGQQLSTTRANAIAGRLVARCGTRVPGLVTLGLTHTFPSPSALAKADLEGLGLTPARARAIRGFAQAALDGTVRLDRSAPLDELIGSLTALDGIALQTAHHLALRLGEPDAFPANESAVQDALGLHARRPSAAVEAVIEQWRPWRALVASHLSLTDAPAVRRRTAPRLRTAAGAA